MTKMQEWEEMAHPLSVIDETIKTNMVTSGRRVHDFKNAYKLIFNSMAEGFVLLDLTCDERGRVDDYHIVDVNPACKRIFTQNPGEGENQFRIQINQVVSSFGLEMFGRVVLQEESASAKEWYSDDLKRWFRIKITQAGTTSVALFVTDISEQKNVEGRLRQCQDADCELHLKSREEVRRLAQFPEENPNPVLRCDANGTPLYVNDSARQWLLSLGSSGKIPLPESLYELVRKAATSNKVIDGEVTSSAGRTFGVSAIRPAGEEYINLYGIDLTERKMVQETLERSNQELEQFVYVASHDLQEPLRAIVGFLQLLEARLEGKVDDKGRHYITRTIMAGHRLQRLIRDLLTFSRVHSKGSAIQTTDLNLILEKTFNNLKHLIEQKDAEIRSATLPSLFVDATQIRLLLHNLIENALQYNESPKPSIEIGFEDIDSMYRFYVQDNGIGISPRFYERIFVIFQRLHTEREYSGTGLGLALCKKIIERHGGTIWVTANPQGGSIFHFTLPKVRDGKYGDNGGI